MSRAHVLKWISYPNTVADRLSGYVGRVHGRPFGPSGRGNRTDRRNGGGRTRRSRAPGGRSDARSSSVSVPEDEFCTVETPGTSRQSAAARSAAPHRSSWRMNGGVLTDRPLRTVNEHTPHAHRRNRSSDGPPRPGESSHVRNWRSHGTAMACRGEHSPGRRRRPGMKRHDRSPSLTARFSGAPNPRRAPAPAPTARTVLWRRQAAEPRGNGPRSPPAITRGGDPGPRERLRGL